MNSHLATPMLALCLRIMAVVIALSVLWRLRPRLARVFSRVIGRFDVIEDRLFGQLSPRRAQLLRALSIGLIVGSGACLLVETSNIKQGLEADFIDRWFNLRFPQRSHAERLTDNAAQPKSRRDDVVIVALDEDTIAHLGWPLPRRSYARLIDRLRIAEPRSIAFDLSILDAHREHPEWDAEVGAAAARAGNVFFSYVLTIAPRGAASPSATAQHTLAANLIPWHDDARQLPEFAYLSGHAMAPQMVIDAIAEKVHGVGMTNVIFDGNDDALRHSLLVLRLGETLHPALSLRIAADVLNVPLAQVRVHPGSHIDLGGKLRIPVNEFGQTLVRYQGRSSQNGDGPFRQFSLGSILRSDDTVTLAESPMGEDQEFIIDERTRDPDQRAPSLQPGAVLSGIADYTSDPGRILELAPADAKAAVAFEVLDESRMRFFTKVRSLTHRGMQPASLRGRHVIVGSTALAAADVHNGPLGAIPGVEYQATMLSNILRSDFFVPAPIWSRSALTLLLSLLAALCGSLFSPSLGLILAALLAVLSAFGVFLAFSAGLYMPAVGPAAALLLSYGLCVLLSLRAEGKARARAEAGRAFVRRTFGRYLTDQVVQEILDVPDGLKLGGQRRFVTLMMTDLRGFTSMCGAMEPEDVVRLLNHYLESMTAIIMRHGGTIDEFIGDAILVMFGAPLRREDEALRAVACAIEMLNAMAAVNAWNRAHNLPVVEMGIGIHSGEVVIGNIGSDLRAKYGIVGATINLTSRVESYTVGGQVLISDATRQCCGENLILGASQEVAPKGVRGTLTLHEALAVKAPFDVKLDEVAESMVAPETPLAVRYAILVNKDIGTLAAEATIDALSDRGLELRIDAGGEVSLFANLALRLVDANGALRPGEIYGKVLRTNVRPDVIYVRLTSVSAEAREKLDGARHSPASRVSIPPRFH